METGLRIGLIVRTENCGLGTLSWEFANHLKPTKVLMLSNGVFQPFPDRYSQFDSKQTVVGKVTEQDMDWLVDGIDVLVGIETFYEYALIRKARAKGVKTALVTMFEMTESQPEEKPDLYICPSKLDYDVMPNPKVYLPIPFNTDRLVWRQRKTATTFVCRASHGGVNGRKGVGLLIEATKYLQRNVKIIISTWQNIRVYDPRVQVKLINYKNYWQCWQEGDVVIHPQDYNGICLPVQEAFVSGLGVLTTDIYPFNEYLPKRLMYKHRGLYKTRASANLLEVDAAKIDARDIAAKIDEIAGTDITQESLAGKKYAEENSWKVLLPQYLKALTELCNQS